MAGTGAREPPAPVNSTIESLHLNPAANRAFRKRAHQGAGQARHAIAQPDEQSISSAAASLTGLAARDRACNEARIRLPWDRSISWNLGIVARTLSSSGSLVYMPPTSG